ncbi:terminase small subunit [Planococcus wigleyi]|uniref:Terminase small subunit n=1 Tax=Planococcus wigleyi TaxID=2762216 RepID=A0ABR8WA24_9BACL|nr:terminase small subunit [Planococcus wigleyi]MBD8013878.1 terminase small subunit [Planococcus wigleyi]
MVKFTEKQQRFIDEYLVDLNATQAAIRAGYSERTASAQASRLLTNVNIRARIEELKKTRADRLNLDAYWVLKRLMDISDRAMQAEPVMEWDHSEQQLVPSGEYQFDSSGANRSTELIGKHLGMFKETVKHEGEVNVTFIDDIGGGKDGP